MPDKDLHHPNDKLLKATFSIPENARAFFQHHLPQDIATALVWDSLRLEPSSFVDPQFAASESDLLFHITFQDTETFLYLLFEHQSTEDPRMALRLLAYVVRIWERFAQNHPHPAKLPPIFPLVLAQGSKPWRASTKLDDLLDLKPSIAPVLRPWQPSFVYQLLELVSTPYEKLGGTPEGILALRALKAEPVSELLGDQVLDESLFPLVSKDALERLMRYIFNGEVNKDLFMERISQLKTTALRINTMTLADQFREEGKLEGINEGRAEGLLIAMRNSVLRALEYKHGDLPGGLREAVQSVTVTAKLEALLEHAFQSDSIEAFSRHL